MSIFISVLWDGWIHWEFKVGVLEVMEIRKLIKLNRREKPKSCLLLCYIMRENVSLTHIILGQNALVWKDCDMSHCSLCGVSLLNEGNEILLVLSSQADVSLFLITPGAKECQTTGRKGIVPKMSSSSFGDLYKFFGPLDILDPKFLPLTTVPIVKESLEKFVWNTLVG